MNDNNNSFSSYDGYYSNNNFQFTDLTTPLDINSSNHYFSSIAEGFASPQPFLSTPSSSSTTAATEPTPTSLITIHSNNLLPFVQIHTTNAQPTNNSFGNIFRRQQTHEEIKSELPIKSEQSDAAATASATSAQQNTSANSTPPVGPDHVTPPVKTVPKPQPQEPQSNPQKILQVQKCNQCPFLCLQAEFLENHVATAHCGNEPSEYPNQKISCPGCDNIFYAKESLEVHLISDHLMCKEEAQQLVSNIPESETEPEPEPEPEPQEPRKSRIYLKNVEFLCEPQRQQESVLLDLDDQGFCNAFQSNNDSSLMNLICDQNNVPSENPPAPPPPTQIPETQPEKQKISIKSVDVLREPALMRRTDGNSFEFLPPILTNNQGDGLCLESTDILCYPNFVVPQTDLADLCQTEPQQNHLVDTQQSHETQVPDKPRRPKIYIKNVDILKEPIFLPPDNLTSVLNVHDDLHFTNLLPTNDDEFDGTKFIEGINNEYSFDCGGQNFVDCANFLLPSEDFMQQQQDQQQQEQDLPKSKIFIKNVDILKQPQFQEHPRRSTNFLHLRTVDELNLMNKNEVENLMAPNLEQNITSIETPLLPSNSSENSKNSEEVCGYRMMNQDSNSFNKPTDFQTPPAITWTNGYVLDGLDTIIDSNSEGEQKNRHYDLNTPQISIDVNDIAGGDTHDPEILFVCAEELINDNRDQNDAIQSIQSDPSEREKRSFEIVEILDDLERDQPSQESSQQESVVVPAVKETLPENNENATLVMDVDPVVVSNEKGRIYVADNLMEVEKGTSDALDVSEQSEKPKDDANFKPKPRGRPFGSNRTGLTKIRKIHANSTLVDQGEKCDFEGCSFRFKKKEVSDYHKRCHNEEVSHPMICPECNSTNFSNWNTLHTHLWRTHKIDMELHSCELCNFKTPIYSRLINTHSKIHSEERNYKCDQCEKAFKNSKQLKNHRRWHRTIAIAPPPDVYRCKECGSAFSHLKSLREHFCKDSDLFCCEICRKSLSSKSSLKLHMLTHESAKKFKCDSCDYMANDHNAFRRHRMTHDKSKMYICPLCDYKSIQSVAFQKHIKLKHPESADTIVHTCKFCPFATINVGLLTVHLAKHKLRDELEGQKDKTNPTNVETSSPVPSCASMSTITTMSMSMPMPDEYFFDSDGNNISSSNLIASNTSETSLIVVPSTVATAAAVAAVATATSNTETEHLNYKIIESSTIIETDSNQQLRNKIKVKSDLVLTDPAKFNSTNAMSPLLLNCFDGAVR